VLTGVFGVIQSSYARSELLSHDTASAQFCAVPIRLCTPCAHHKIHLQGEPVPSRSSDGKFDGRLHLSSMRASWQGLSAGAGSKGERWYDWALIDTLDEAADPAETSTGHHWLPIRRNRTTGE